MFHQYDVVSVESFNTESLPLLEWWKKHHSKSWFFQALTKYKAFEVLSVRKIGKKKKTFFEIEFFDKRSGYFGYGDLRTRGLVPIILFYKIDFLEVIANNRKVYEAKKALKEMNSDSSKYKWWIKDS